jgi:alpha-mannosidase
MLSVDPAAIELSTWKPSEDGVGSIVRLLNPGDEPLRATLRTGDPLTQALAAVEAVRLDERPAPEIAVQWEGDRIEIDVPPHALRSLRLRTRSTRAGG